MPDPLVEIPDRPAFKAAEVCEIAHIPPYVLRSWEKEFPNLGVVARPGGPRVYRRGDVEQILRIKQLVFSEGLTLAGARRKLEGDPPVEAEAAFELPVPEEVKAKVTRAKHELRNLLDMLSPRSPSTAAEATPAAADIPQPAAEPIPATEPASTWPPAPPARVVQIAAAHAEAEDEEPGLPLADPAPGAAAPSVPTRPKRLRRRQ